MLSLNQPPTLLGNRYQLIDRLGVGGMGIVYRATDRLTNQQVALKQVSLGTDNSPVLESSRNSSTDFRVLLSQEFRILASLRHPNIINVLDYGFAPDKQPYFTMTLLDAPESFVSYCQQQTFEVQINLISQMLQALAYLHRQRILHCDLKPGNVLVSKGEVKVLDFGLALVTQKREERTEDHIVGTIAYMSPELLQGSIATISSDLYAVGIMMYQVFTGRYPFDSSDTSRLIYNILNSDPDLTSLNFSKRITQQAELFSYNIDLNLLNSRMVSIIQRLLNRDIDLRYHDAELVIADLCEALGKPMPEESIAIRESFLQAAQFVGREAELDQLESALKEAHNGRGSTWLVGGESGIGKTRFLDELSHQAMIAGMLVLRGQALENKGLPYQLWRNLIRPLVLVSELDLLTASVLKAIVPDIGSLLGRSIPDAPEIDAAAWQQRLLLAIVDAFGHSPTPILLLLDDLQWAGNNLDPLKTLNRLAPTLPLMIVGSYRNDEYPNLPAAVPEMRVLPLARLSPENITELSTAILGEIQPQLLDLLQHETEGNAFFLVESVRMLAQEAGRLSQITQRAQQALPEKILANGVLTLLHTRLARLSLDAQNILKAAAVGGRQIDLAVLGRIFSQTNLKLEVWLTQCVNAAILNRQNDRWQFLHDKFRETLLTELEPDEHKMLHRQTAEAIEYIYPDDLAYSAMLADLWHEAGNLEKEYYYALVAGKQALAEAHLQDAVSMGKRAFSLINPKQGEAIILYRLLADAYWGMSNYPEAKANYEASLALAQQWNDRLGVAMALRGLGDVAWRQSNYVESQTHFEACLSLCRDLRQRYEVMRVLQSLGWVAIHQGDYQKARTYYEESLTLCRESGALISIAEALRGLGEVMLQLRDYAAARTYYDEGLVLARRTGDRRIIAGLCRGLGEVAQYQGDFAYARACFEELLSIMRQIGDPRGMSMALYGLGVIAIQQAEYETARTYQAEGLTLVRSIGARRGIATNLCNLAFIELKLNHIALAEEYLWEALSGGQETADLPVILNALSVYAWLFAAKNQLDRSAELVRLVSSRPETPTYAIKLIAPLQNAAGETLPQRSLDEIVTDILAAG